jgi:glycerol-1-phosphate dehydrogenase [NAD(P)+]
LRAMVFEADAIARLSSILTDVGARAARPVLLVVDSTPMRRGDADLKLQVAQRLRADGREVEACVAPTDSDGQAHTDLEQIDAVRQRIRAGTAIVSLGSGTITDIAKQAAHLFEQSSGTTIPYIAVAAANSLSA